MVEYRNQQGERDVELKLSAGIVIQTDFEFDSVSVDDKDSFLFAVMNGSFIYVIGNTVGRSKMTLTEKGSGAETEFTFHVTPHSTSKP